MRGVWWTLKRVAGLVLVGCLLCIPVVELFPQLFRLAGTWLAVLLVAAAVYRVANTRLGRLARPRAASRLQGGLFVLPAPLLRQGVLSVVLLGLGVGIPLPFIRAGSLPGWRGAVALLGALLCLWLCRASVIGLLHLRRAGYALKLDAAGIHYPGLPLLPWTQVTGLALVPPRPRTDRPQRLVLQMLHPPDKPSGLRALWHAPLPGASIGKHAVSLPLPTLRKPTLVLDSAQALWRRHGQRPP